MYNMVQTASTAYVYDFESFFLTSGNSTLYMYIRVPFGSDVGCVYSVFGCDLEGLQLAIERS